MTKCVLGDVADVIISGVDKKTKDGEEKVRLCNYTDVYYNWAITGDKRDGLMEASAKPEEIRKFKIRKGLVALTKDSETRNDIGIPTYIADDFEDVILGYHCALITPHDKQLDGKYLNALLRTKYAKEFFANNAGGSGQRYYLSDTSIKELPLFLPDFAEQKRIGKFLSAIDRKIALNRKRIATLEAMAKEIYDYWFVQFDFPDAHGRPYKSSGGAMVYNPDLKREIPKGWEVKSLGEIAEVVNGATPSTANPRNYDGDVVWITPKDLSDQRSKFTYGGSRTISREGYDSCSTHMLPRGSILMSSRAPIGLLSIAAVDLCTNQGFKSFVPKEIDDNLYLYYYLKEHMAQVEAMGSGTTFKEVSRESMISFSIPYVSDRKVYASFVAIAKPIFNQQELLGTELARLSALRDILLPVLMNGQGCIGDGT